MRRHREKINTSWTSDSDGLIILLAILAPFLAIYGIYWIIKKVMGF